MIGLGVLLFLAYLLGCGVGLGLGALFLHIVYADDRGPGRQACDHDKETPPHGFHGGVRRGVR